MQLVVAQAAVDDVVGVQRAECRDARHRAGRVEVVGRQDGDVLQLAGAVDRRLLDVAGRRDRLGRGRREAVERLGGAGPADQDPAVVAQDAVVASAAGDPVVAVAADDHVVPGVAVEDVAAAAPVDEVVAVLAVDLACGADVTDPVAGLGPGHTGASLAGQVGAAGRVVEQGDRTLDDPGTRVGVVGGADEAAGPDQVVDVRVVGGDRVGVGGVRAVAHVVAIDRRARAAEDQVRRVAALRHRGLAEEVGAAAHDVVLALVAEDHVAAAAAFDVVASVRTHQVVLRRAQVQGVGGVAVGAHARAARGGDVVDRAVALDGVVAELAEEHVVARAAGDVVVAVVRRVGARGDVEQRDLEVAPPVRATRVGLRGRADARGLAQGRAGGAVERAGHRPEARAAVVANAAGAVDDGVVAEHQVVPGTAVEGVISGSAKDQVTAGTAVDDVVAALVVVDRRRHQQVVAAGVGAVGKRAVVPEDHVAAARRADVVVARTADEDVVSAAGHDGVARPVARVRADNCAQPRDPAVGRFELDVPVVAEDQVRVEVAVRADRDRITARAGQDDVAARAADDRVVAGVARPHRPDPGHIPGGQDPVGARRLGDHAVVAEDDVVPGATIDGVVPGRQLVAGRRLLSVRAVDDGQDLGR